MPFLIDIDFTEFDTWWTSSSPSIFSEPDSKQNALVYYDDDHISISPPSRVTQVKFLLAISDGILQ